MNKNISSSMALPTAAVAKERSQIRAYEKDFKFAMAISNEIFKAIDEGKYFIHVNGEISQYIVDSLEELGYKISGSWMNGFCISWED